MSILASVGIRNLEGVTQIQTRGIPGFYESGCVI
jgi:hypothetical protein